MNAPTKPCQVIFAPSREAPRGDKSIFLAGSTTYQAGEPDWREALSESLQDLPVTIFNPCRADWDSSWREEPSFEPYRHQIEWEFEMQQKADILVVYFHPATKAPCSLLEFGLWARENKAIVVCPREFWKSGHVEMACLKFGVDMVELDKLQDAIRAKLAAIVQG